MSNPKISIIVPVYNSEKYLCRCIDSVLEQTYSDFELLLVDDGSKDNSGKICDEYATKDHRIKVFHKENKGVSSARNFGINVAIGEWVIFIDSDDYFTPKALYLLLNAAIDNNVFISSGNYWFEKNNVRWKFKKNGNEHIVRNNYMGQYFHTFSLRAGVALYSRNLLINRLYDVNLNRYEDLKHICEIIKHEKIIYIPSCVMVYSLDKENGLSKKAVDRHKDFIFNLDFKGKHFWECMLLGRLLNQGYKLYPEFSNELDEIYKNFRKWGYLDKIISFLHIGKIIRLIGFC